jgi:cytochrome c553
MRGNLLLAATLTNIGSVFGAIVGSSKLAQLKAFVTKTIVTSVIVSAALITSGSLQAEVSYTDGDAAAGKEKSTTCAMCHGADGNSPATTFPKIAGQNARYAFKQLKDMKKGLRQVDEMAAIVAGLSEQDMADLAAYYSLQSTTLGAVDPELKDLGESIYRGGVAEREVPACIACHGPNGTGMPSAGFPTLSGQHSGYTAAQLSAFRASARGDFDVKHRANDGDSMIMRAGVKRMTDEEIKAVSSYVSGLY